MPNGLIGTILKLLVASLIVGLVMSLFNVTPRSLIDNFGETVQEAARALSGIVGWAVDYVLIGAVIVVPIWLLIRIFDRARNRS